MGRNRIASVLKMWRFERYNFQRQCSKTRRHHGSAFRVSSASSHGDSIIFRCYFYLDMYDKLCGSSSGSEPNEK